MYQPEQYAIVLAFMIVSMLCWGSWANTLKLCPRFPFQLFYWDYTIGLVLGVLFWSLTLGTFGHAGPAFFDDLKQVQLSSALWAFAGGAILQHRQSPHRRRPSTSPEWPSPFPHRHRSRARRRLRRRISHCAPSAIRCSSFGGVALVAAAIVCDALAYKARSGTEQSVQTKGIVLSLVGGCPDGKPSIRW